LQAQKFARRARYPSALLGFVLMADHLAYAMDTVHVASGLVRGAALIVLSLPRGCIEPRYDGWEAPTG
jgi:hypothetical protein